MIISNSKGNLICKVQSRHYKLIKVLFYSEIHKHMSKSNSNRVKMSDKIFISNDTIIDFMGYHNLLNYSQIGLYNIINFILKQKLIFLLTNKNRFNIGFNTNLTNNNVTSLRSSVKIHTPYYSKTVGQFKLDFRAAIIFNIIPIETLELLFLNNTINKKATKEYVLKIINFK